MPRPILCFYYLTYRCNARCSFCYISREESSLAESATVISHLEQMKSLKIRYIDFTGGEPLLHPDLPLFLRKASELGFYTTVTTNCLLYPKRANELKGLVDFLHFSLDSAEQVQHDAIRGISCFDKVIESLEIASSLQERPDILMTMTRDNFEQIEPLLKIARKYKLILILNPVFDYVGENSPDRDLALKMLTIPDRKYLYNNTAFLRMMLEGGNDPRKPRCKAVSSTMVISPQGELLLPCFHRASERIDLKAGLENARRSSFFKRALQKQGRYDFCRGCTINCYFDPSFLYTPDELFIRSLIAKAKYVYDKYLTA